MNRDAIRSKFGADYCANDRTFRMGLDVRFTDHLADRFKGRVVLETCAGGGFTSIALARKAEYVFSVEIDSERLFDAKRNAALAGFRGNVTFIRADIFDVESTRLIDRLMQRWWTRIGQTRISIMCTGLKIQRRCHLQTGYWTTWLTTQRTLRWFNHRW